MITIIWLAAAALYGMFLYWYFNWSGPLSEAEVEQIIGRFSEQSGSGKTDLEVLRTFLQQDDGKEFVMQNSVKLHPGSIPHPVTGDSVTARDLLEGYTKPFIKALFARGGHPVYMARKVGGYIDSWSCDADPQWTFTAMMRYRSRRDLAVLASDSRFSAIHSFKTLAIAATVSFPVQIQLSFFMRPPVYVPLMLLWLASMLHFATVIFVPL